MLQTFKLYAVFNVVLGKTLLIFFLAGKNRTQLLAAEKKGKKIKIPDWGKGSMAQILAGKSIYYLRLAGSEERI